MAVSRGTRLACGAAPLAAVRLLAWVADVGGDLVVAAGHETGGLQPPAARGRNAPDPPVHAEPLTQHPGQDRVAAAGGETLQLTVPGELQREDIALE